jgi:dihydrofolate reductase
MRRLIESTLVSLDGVTEAPERWANFDAEDTARSLDELGKYDAFVMGRATYENFQANWSHVTGSPYMDLINGMPKYVASRTLTKTKWNATLLGADPSSAIAQLKSQPGKDLIKYGTSHLDDTLVRDRLIEGLSRKRCFRRSPSVVFGGRESVGEGDRERVERWLPPHGPSCSSSAGGVQ